MRSRSRSYLALAATAALAFAACTRENGTLGPAPFPNSPTVFTDNFGESVNFAAFGGSKVDALSIDNTVKHSGSSSLKITVPSVGDPAGSYAGGAFVVGVPRDLSSYNVLSFWARASIPAVLNVAGIGNDNTGNSLYTAERNNIQLTTSWAKYTIAIPLASKLIEEQGLFYFAEGPENGVGYEIWIDDVRFEELNTVVNVRPTIAGGTILEDIGGTRTITGTAVTVAVDGVDQTVNAYPAYFTFASSNAAVATVSAAGVVTVLGAGTTNITATLGTTPAAGTLALTGIAPPAVAAPTPTRLAADVISLFSNAYTNVPVGTFSADWDQADVADVQIAGNAVKKYSNLTYAGIDFGANQINATAMTYLHLDVWVGDASSFKVKLVDFGANGAFGGGDDREHELTLNTTTTPAMTANAWSSLDIPLSAFTGLTTRAHLAQVILLGASRTVYLDNLYLYKLPAPTAPTTAAPTPTVNAANVISMFSNAYTNVPVDTWRTDWSNGTVSDTTIAGNATKKYSNLTFAGIEAVSTQIDATAMTHFHMDIWTPDAVTGGAAFKVKLVDFGANGAFAGGDDVEHELTFNATSTPALATGSWVSLDLPLSAFTGLTTRAHVAQVVIVGDDPINTVFVDNVYFYSATGIAPTVAITSGTAGTATGPVTFTFTFSADVGTSFTAGDVVVTGGTAGTLNQTDATHYTMVVTPNAASTGTITVSVAAATFTSLGGAANTAAASLDQPYDTTGGGSGNVVVSFDETTAPTLSPFEGVTEATVVADPTNASNMVARITNGAQGPSTQPWAGVTVSTGGQFSIPQMNVTASLTRMTARVYSPAVGLVIRAKAENAVNGAQNHETNATTTVANAWETLTFDFTVASPTFDGGPTNPFSATDTYNKLSFFLDYGTKTNAAPRVFYLDDIRFEGTVGSALPLPLPVLAPTTLPGAPTLAPADVISLLNSSATYTNIAVGNWNPDWGQGGSISDTVIATRTIKLLNLVNYQGVNVSPDGSATGALDITGKNTLHISYWTSDGTSLIFSPINATAEYPINVGAITRGAWTDLEIPIDQAGFALTGIRQLKFETNSGQGHFYLDNVYFHTPVAAAPTVVITSGTAGTATGPVTFTFTFSEDVGTSFIAGDVAVTGGTTGTLDRTDATHYTMVVTPTANATGTITVTVGAGTFTNLAGTANTAAATIDQAFNTEPPPSGNVVVSFDETTAPTLSPFEGVTAASVVADPNNASNMVAMITNGVQGAANPWAGVTVSTGGQFSIPQMNVTASLTRMTVRVWSPAIGLRIRAKAENATNPAQNHETNATTLTTVANAWETLTFDFAVASPLFDGLPTNPFSATDTYNKLSFFLDYGTKTNTEPRVFYLDDIRFEGTVGTALPFPPPVLAPTTLPAAPSLAAANVISLHNSSGTYTNIAVGNWNPNWGQGGSISDFTVGAGTVKFLNLVNYQGINISPDGLAPGALDITGKNTLHISYWTADGESLRISPINASTEYAITVSSITKNGWTELEIPINQAGFSLTSIRQLKFETTTGLGRFYLDNIYFH